MNEPTSTKEQAAPAGLVLDGPAKGQIVRNGIACRMVRQGTRYRRVETYPGIFQWETFSLDLYRPAPEWDVELAQQRNRREQARKKKESDES